MQRRRIEAVCGLELKTCYLQIIMSPQRLVLLGLAALVLGLFKETESSEEEIPSEVSPEKEQRLCLHRLLDAMRTLCSEGRDSRVPLYYNPHSTRSWKNDTERASRNLRNEISMMANYDQEEGGRRFIRRRSRRNIVRECCYSTCSPSSLVKYCDQTVRVSNYPRGGTSATTGRGANMVSPIQQCVTVADLKAYYMKFFKTQWKKDAGAIASVPDKQSFTNLTKATSNQMTTTTMEVTKSEDETQATSNESEEANHSPNIVTAKPVTRYINFPRGTNEY